MRSLLLFLMCLPSLVHARVMPSQFSAAIDHRQYFIENNGHYQASSIQGLTDSIYFTYEGSFEQYFFTNHGVYVLWEMREEKHNPAVYLIKNFAAEEMVNVMEREGEFHKDKQYGIYSQWKNTNEHVKIVATEKTDHYYTYPGSNSIAGAFRKITYVDIYPGIDIEYTIPSDRSGIKYTIILHPGADYQQLEFEYSGESCKTALTGEGEILISTRNEKIGLTESAPITSYLISGNTIDSEFYISEKNKVKFNLHGITSINETIVIDPWITPIVGAVAQNIGYDVDYDADRNLFVYFSGSGGGDNFISKYSSSNGTLLWTHIIPNTTYTGNFLVEKNTGRVYFSEGFNTSGARVFRLNPNGLTDGFVSNQNAIANEFWNVGFNCADGGSILAIGGGTASNLNGGIINTTTGSIAIQNFTGIPGAQQDVVSFAIDNQGRLFAIFASVASTIDNKLALINSALNNAIYIVPSGGTPFNESNNHVAFLNVANHFNALAVNDNYLVSYDGRNLRAFNPDNGAILATTVITSHSVKLQGGIAIDDANNVYIGGSSGNILYFNFDGSNFTQLGDLSLGWTGAATNVFDIVYDRSTNYLFVSGRKNIGIVESPAIITNNLLSVSGNCGVPGQAVATAELNVVSSNAVVTYTWKNSSGQVLAQTIDTDSMTNTVVGLESGVYYITAQLNAPCGPEFADSVLIVCPNCSVSVITLDASCHGSSDGNAVSNMESGDPPFIFEWNTNPIQTTSEAQNLVAGNYEVTVTDSTGCVTSASITIHEPPVLQVAISDLENVSCYGVQDGFADVVVSGGSAPYTYEWNSVPAQTTSLADSLGPGQYDVLIYDAHNCFVQTTAVIAEPDSLICVIDGWINNTCFGDSLGTAGASASGGTTPYSFSWDTNPTINGADASNLAAGHYIVTVTDDHQCISSADVSISEPDSLELFISDTIHVLCNGNSTGSAIAVANGGMGSYHFHWNTSPVQTSAQAVGLVAGNYSVSVTDDNGCFREITIDIIEPPALQVSITDTINVLCYQDSSGSATALADGGSGIYHYTWNSDPEQHAATAMNLTSGDYTVEVKDDHQCLSYASVFISEPDLFLAEVVSKTDNVCFGDSTGTSEAALSGGVPPYTFQWSTTLVSMPIDHLPAGNFTFSANDANGCNAETSVEILQPTPLVIDTVLISSVSCFGGSDGTAHAFVEGGTVPYSYVWNTSPATYDEFVSGLPSGNYLVEILDAFTCSTFAEIVIPEPYPLHISIVDSTHVLCYGGNTGAVTTIASGGTLPYALAWNTSSAQSTTTIDHLFAGTYIVSISDANNCSASDTVTLNEPTLLEIVISDYGDVHCFGGHDGFANAIATGGTLPYSFVWNTVPIQNNASAIQLISEDYIVEVEDENGCTATASIAISQPEQLQITQNNLIHVSCFGENDGSIGIDVSGGTGAYAFEWNTVPALYTASISNLNAGNYTVSVNDSAGCVIVDSFAIVQPQPLIASIASFSNILCFGESNGSIAASASGGVGPYDYVWNIPESQSSPTVSNLGPGVYSVMITDSHDCEAQSSVELTQPLSLTLVLDAFDATCDGYCDGHLAGVADGGTLPYAFSWTLNELTIGGNNAQLESACAGSYLLNVTDANGCTEVQMEEVLSPPPIQSQIVLSPQICENECSGRIEFQSSNDMFYSIDGGINFQADNIFLNLCQGDYSTVIADSNNCTLEELVTISILPQPEASFYFTPGDATYSNPTISFANASVNADFYNWNFANVSSSDEFELSYTFPNNGPGNYPVCLSVSNYNGCTDTLCQDVLIGDEFSLYVPNAFTPTSDKLNEFFAPVIGGITPILYHFQIFNRWGELIFESNDPKTGWNGGYDSTFCQPDVYVWKLQIQVPGEEIDSDYSGHVTLLR